MSTCAICQGQPPLCTRCEIRALKLEVLELKRVNQYLTRGNSILFDFEGSDYRIINMFSTFSSFKVGHDIAYHSATLKFYTLTFDPAKFGVSNDMELEKQYMLIQIGKAYRDFNCTYVYGCFEYHKTGAVHTHFILKSYDNHPKIYKFLKYRFTDNPSNRCAIVVKAVADYGVIKYINKESTEFYQIGLLPQEPIV